MAAGTDQTFLEEAPMKCRAQILLAVVFVATSARAESGDLFVVLDSAGNEHRIGVPSGDAF